MNPAPLFDYMRERHLVYLRRQEGLPRSSWTQDPILQQWRFCNVFRELDRTTIWFREHVRDRVAPEDILLATVLFRWFNRITTGEAIFEQSGIQAQDGGTTTVATAWDCRCGSRAKNWTPVLAGAIRSYCGTGPYVTGAYIIKTPDGRDKLHGVLDCLEQFMLQEHSYPGAEQLGDLGFQEVSEMLLAQESWDDPQARVGSLEATWQWLRQFPYLGDFMAYEVVTDLRHTPLLRWAPDIMTWANPGPGAMRGLNRLSGRDLDKRLPRTVYIEEMRQLLAISEDRELWPGDWPTLEMRDIEHSLCELDKYLRVRTGQGQPRNRFR